MIRIGITYRLFLAIFFTASIAILSMFFVMQWSVNKAFLRYLNNIVNHDIEIMAKNLQNDYGRHGSWAFFRDDPLLWTTRIMEDRRKDASAGGQDRSALPPKMPFVILDENGRSLFGEPDRLEKIHYRPILHNDKTVGYIGHYSPSHFLNPPQLQFLRDQKHAIFTAVCILGLIGLLFSLPLAQRLVRPIKNMSGAIRELSSGKYSVRVPVTSSDELGTLAQSFNNMALALENNERARQQWVMDISHELRTPLAILRGEIEALMEGIRPITAEAIGSLHAETARLTRLVEDLHQLTLSDLGALTYRKDDVDPAEALWEAARARQPEFVRKGTKFTINVPEGSDRCIFADGGRLRQLFTNLFDNSLKYTDPGGEILVGLTYDGPNAVIEFSDSSPGVDDKDLGRLFDRLYRVDSSRNRTLGGAGLGLSICKNIVEAHEGAITAEASPLGGLLVRIVIPLIKDG